MARDATTGELVWAYNITPADPWDYDQPLQTPLVDLMINGEMRQTAIKAARTGKIGDGKIFVTSVEQVVRIRTGETDEAAV